MRGVLSTVINILIAVYYISYIIKMAQTKNMFNIDDYKELNRDLKFNTNDKYLLHWTTIGIKQMRLCNKKQLVVTNEFSIEILLHICYYYYLYKNNLLFDNKITTYVGMKPLYYFLKESQIIEKRERRVWTAPYHNPLMINYNEHIHKFDSKFWIPPEYKEYYKNEHFSNLFKTKKDLLVISNKYNVEWGIAPLNFIPTDTLCSLIDLLQDKYNIVYIRPGININTRKITGYSWDHTVNIDLNDIDTVKTKYKSTVTIFDDLFMLNQFRGMSYNLLKLYLFSSCDNYIGVQGGGSHFISFFSKKLVILHKHGPELASNCYTGWYNDTCKNNNMCIRVVQSENDLISESVELFG